MITQHDRASMHDDLGAAVFEALGLPLLVVGDDLRIARSNLAADELFDYAGEGLAGRALREIVDPAYHDGLAERWAAAKASDGSTGRNGHFRARDGEPLQLSFVLHPDVVDGHSLLLVRDVPERRLRDAEDELRSQLLDQLDAAIVVLDDQRRIVVWNSGAERLYGWPRAVAMGKTGDELGMIVDDETQVEADRARGQLDAGGRSRVQITVRRRDGTVVPIEAHGTAIRRPDGGIAQRAYVVIDVSSRQGREDQLRRRAQMQEAVAELGREALADNDLPRLLQRACECVAEVLDAPFVKVMELEPGTADLILRAAVGWDDSLIGTPHVPAIDSHSGHAMEVGEVILLEDLDLEWRFHGVEVLREQSIRSGIATTIRGPEAPYGAIAAHHPEPGHFDRDQAAFVESVANVLAAAIAGQRQRA